MAALYHAARRTGASGMDRKTKGEKMSNIAAFQGDATIASLARIPLRTAYLCGVCRTIFNGAPRGECRVCGSSAVRSVAELLLSAEERAAWLQQLSRRVKDRVAKTAQREQPPAVGENITSLKENCHD